MNAAAAMKRLRELRREMDVDVEGVGEERREA